MCAACSAGAWLGTSCEPAKVPTPLVCPVTHQRVVLMSRARATELLGRDLDALRIGTGSLAPQPLGVTDEVLVRDDHAIAYPIAADIPVLLAPEALGSATQRRTFDLGSPRYAEAYEEMDFYNEVGRSKALDVEGSTAYAYVSAVTRAGPAAGATFPDPWQVWLDARYDCNAQWDAYQHLAPIRDQRVLQLGGTGGHVVKFLVGGAIEGWLVTPMLGEIRFAQALADTVGVADRLRCVMGIAEELPFPPESFDRVLSMGCLHHMDTSVVFDEVARVLDADGRFAAVDPWRAPLYGIGTRIFGKREVEVHCRPLTRDRVAPLEVALPSSRIVQHGTFTRYPLIAMDKLGHESRLRTVRQITQYDDRIASLLRLRRFGSSVATLATKEPATWAEPARAVRP